MIRIFVLFILYFFAHQSFAQCPPDSFNMEGLYHFDPPNMPSTPGGVEYNDVWGYTNSNGDEFAIVGSVDTIYIFDVSDPAAVVKVMAHATPNTCLWRDFKTYDDHLYASSDGCPEGLLIFDLSNLPASATYIGQFNQFWGDTHNIFIDENSGRLYSVGSDAQLIVETLILILFVINL